ncbi:hypothetical protein BV25DRAFT_896399 [Artomyces pyxidatus]|uniref:Uncharacterized protein n=1 Tax=Artomyces pyxidatus TaxID=48021 RepID=A0ACB8SXA8_9AGAM|nr:hypothetical protein BV25DRAFT_896399 [Artomyces pyxidatus]
MDSSDSDSGLEDSLQASDDSLPTEQVSVSRGYSIGSIQTRDRSAAFPWRRYSQTTRSTLSWAIRASSLDGVAEAITCEAAARYTEGHKGVAPSVTSASLCSCSICERSILKAAVSGDSDSYGNQSDAAGGFMDRNDMDQRDSMSRVTDITLEVSSFTGARDGKDVDEDIAIIQRTNLESEQRTEAHLKGMKRGDLNLRGKIGSYCRNKLRTLVEDIRRRASSCPRIPETHVEESCRQDAPQSRAVSDNEHISS